MSGSAEIERKYDVDAAATVPTLGSLAGQVIGDVVIGSATPGETALLRATYFDTATFDLARRRVALRRRAGGADEGWHLKLPAAEGRTELHWPLHSQLPDGVSVPAEVIAHLAEHGLLDEPMPLAPIAQLDTERRILRLATSDGAGLVEVADDRVAATDASTGEQRVWREWEAELLEGAPATREGRDALLDAVEGVLMAAGAVAAASSSKLARALGRSGLGAPASAQGPADDVEHSRWRYSLMNWGSDPLKK